jgi:hypothetical protein
LFTTLIKVAVIDELLSALKIEPLNDAFDVKVIPDIIKAEPFFTINIYIKLS